jgi:hypothetical protein
MKVWWIMESEIYKDEDKLEKYSEYLATWSSLFRKKHEGVKYVHRGSWTDNPGHSMGVAEYESVEEFSKVWCDDELQAGLVKLRKHLKSLRLRVMRPCVNVS